MPKIPKDAKRRIPVGMAPKVHSEDEKNQVSLTDKPAEKETAELSEVSEYYTAVAKKLRNTKYILLLIMVITFALTLFAYRDRLTYDNFRYLLRDMDEAGNTEVSTDTVYYTANETNNYLYFRGDIAVASSYGVEFHRALGDRSFEDKVSFASPSICGSEKYMIVYDAGGKTFYVYNSISRVYNETLERQIVCCAAADNGNFAVLTERDVGGYEITVYNKNFDKIGKITREEYIYSIDFLKSGKLTLTALGSDGVSLYTDFIIYTPGEDKVERSVRENGMILKSGETSYGFYVLTDIGLSFYNSDGSKKASYPFGTSEILFADADGDSVCVFLDENKTSQSCGIYLYDAGGVKSSAYVSGGAKGVALCGDLCAVLYTDEVVTVVGGKKTAVDVPSGGVKIIGRDSDNVIICYDDYAKIFKVR